jgi:hypothetical protein
MATEINLKGDARAPRPDTRLPLSFETLGQQKSGVRC